MNVGRNQIRILSISLCLIFIFSSVPLASAETLYRKEVQYIVEGTYDCTVIEGDVFDNETGDPVGGAGVDGEVHSETIYVDAQADANGHFVVTIAEVGDHEYVLNVHAAGYDPVTVTGSIKSGERKHILIPIKYHPFDLQLSESSGSLGRGYTANTYSGVRSVPFTAQRTVPILNERGKPIYDTIEERTLTSYTWEELVTGYRTEQYTVQVPIVVPKFRAERYVSGWTVVRADRRIIRVPTYSTRQVIDGFTLKFISQTSTRRVPYEYWETRRSATPDFYASSATKTLRDGVRNPRAVYTTTTKQVPRTKTETYTAYRIYSYSGTGYSFLPWENKRVQVNVIPKNGYTGNAEFGVSADAGARASLGSSSLSLASETSTTLNIAPDHASSHVIAVRGYDSNGRFVESRDYTLNLTESLPAGRYSETLVGTTENRPSISPPKIVTATSTQGMQPSPAINISSYPTFSGIYDGGSMGSALTNSFAYRVNPSTGALVFVTDVPAGANWLTPMTYDAQKTSLGQPSEQVRP